MRKNNISAKSPKREARTAQSDRITIGMDLGDKTSRYCMLDATGEVVRGRQCGNHEERDGADVSRP